eukprot:803024-Pleurochrysis_carterae.AAC.1
MGGLPMASEKATCNFPGHNMPASRAATTPAAPLSTAPTGRSPSNNPAPPPASACAGVRRFRRALVSCSRRGRACRDVVE